MTFSLAQAGRKVLVGARGGVTFLTALAGGDVADDATVEARRDTCRFCPSRVRDGGSDWCGKPLTPATAPATCGCLVFGKTLIGSEACPQGKW